MSSNQKTALIITPMPLTPTSAGNRRRGLSILEMFAEYGFDVHLAVTDHEDQIYRTFNQSAKNDLSSMVGSVSRVFYVESEELVRLKTSSEYYEIDDWYPCELDYFIEHYISQHGAPSVVVVNYVFLSKVIEVLHGRSITIIDTHDKFSGRKKMYDQLRQEANFFFTNDAEEQKALCRPDIVLAIQESEKINFEKATDRPVYLLNHLPNEKISSLPDKMKNFVFLGHGNDANLLSVTQFMHLWSAAFPISGAGPRLIIAGEIGNALGNPVLPNVDVIGYVNDIDYVYEIADAIVAPIVFGTGLKIKVVEALARGKIVIGTAIAFEGTGSDFMPHNFASLENMVNFIEMDCGDQINQLWGMTQTVWKSYKTRVVEQQAAVMSHVDKLIYSRMSKENPPLVEQVKVVIGAEANKSDAVPIVPVGGGIYLLAQNDLIDYFNHQFTLEYEGSVLDCWRIFSERRPSKAGQAEKWVDDFSGVREFISVGIAREENHINLKNISLLTLFEGRLNNRRFFPEAYLSDIASEVTSNQSVLQLFCSVARANACWRICARIIKYESNRIVFGILAPSVWAKNLASDKKDCVIKFADSAYDYRAGFKFGFVYDGDISQDIISINNGRLRDNSNNFVPLVPAELSIDRENLYAGEQEIISIFIRIGPLFCTIDVL